MGGYPNDGRAVICFSFGLAYQPGRLNAVHFWHGDVHQDDFGPVQPVRGYDQFAVPDDFRIEASPFHDLAHDDLSYLNIFGHQNVEASVVTS